MMEKVNFGIIGLSHIANSQHMPNMMRAPHINLKTICDLNDEYLNDAHARYPEPIATKNHRDIFDDPEIQAVCLAVQDAVQSPLTIEALEAGKHVYVEKPLAKTSEEAKKVVECQKQNDKHVVIGFNRRRAPSYLKAKSIVESNGGAQNMHYRLSDPGRTLDRTRVISEVCHIFDIMRFFAESDAVSIYCVESRPDEELYVIKFESGCVASITATGYASEDTPKEYLEIFTNDGNREICWDGKITGGLVTVDEFVELRTYGIRDVEHIYRYAGHSHPDREFTHKYLLEHDGANAMRNIRRMYWELKDRYVQDPQNPEFSDNDELYKYLDTDGFKGTNPRVNYMINKGWLESIDYLAESILKGTSPVGTADAEDAWKASLLSHGAIKSRDTGSVVML